MRSEGTLVGKMSDTQNRTTHLDSLGNPEEYRYSKVCCIISETGREFLLVAWLGNKGDVSFLHPCFNAQRLSYLVLFNERSVRSRVNISP